MYVNGLAFLFVPEDLPPFLFEVEPQSQRKKIKAPAIHIPCQSNAMNDTRGCTHPSLCSVLPRLCLPRRVVLASIL